MTVHRLDLRGRKRTSFRDFFPICFIAIFGCFGFAYIFNSNCIENSSLSYSKGNIELASHSLSLAPLMSKKKMPLKINGNATINQLLNFEIINYSPKSLYTLEISNGDRYTLEAQNFDYGFSKVGNYQIKLLIDHPHKMDESWTRDILITKAELAFSE